MQQKSKIHYRAGGRYTSDSSWEGWLLGPELKCSSWAHEQEWRCSEKLRPICAVKALTNICPYFSQLEKFYHLQIRIFFYLLKQPVKKCSWFLLEFTFKHQIKHFTPKLWMQTLLQHPQIIVWAGSFLNYLGSLLKDCLSPSVCLCYFSNSCSTDSQSFLCPVYLWLRLRWKRVVFYRKKKRIKKIS